MKSYRIERIAPLTEALADELIDVWEKSARSSHSFLSEDDLQYYKPRIQQVYFRAVELYAIRMSHRIVAFMGLSDDMVEMLFVLPFEKGKGIGSAMLQFAHENKGIRKVDVNEQNTEAYQFYMNRGYHVTGRSQTDADGKPYPILHMSL